MSSSSASLAETDWKSRRLDEVRQLVYQLLASPTISFDENLRSALPEEPGIYVISETDALPGHFLRAGKTKSAAFGLRQRIYQNHLHGSQAGNLRSHLVNAGICADVNRAKDWIRARCSVQFLVIKDDRARTWAEYLMLALLQPRFCDDNK